MARTSLQNVLSLGDPAQSWNFDFFLPIIPGSSDTRDLTYRCMTSDLPGSQLEALDVALHGVQVPYAGRRMFTQTMSVTFLETVDWETSRKFVRWHEIARSWRMNSGSGSAVYWATGQMVLYNDSAEVARTIQINNIFPENVQEAQLDGSSSQAIQLSLTLRYTDWQETS